MIPDAELFTWIIIVFFAIRVLMKDKRLEGFPVLFSYIQGGICIAADVQTTMYVVFGMVILSVAFFLHLMDTSVDSKRRKYYAK